MRLDLYQTGRGLGLFRGDFKDANGDACSIQDSSALERPLIWLGCEEGNHHRGQCLARMHIDQAQARELARLLNRFARHGSLRPRGGT